MGVVLTEGTEKGGTEVPSLLSEAAYIGRARVRGVPLWRAPLRRRRLCIANISPSYYLT
jgi:hypothetical protein